jgi:hypothetical protein
MGTRWRSRLRHCIASPKVAGSIPDGDLRLRAALRRWGHGEAKRGTSWGVKALPPSCADCRETLGS